jgi:hypothetical protein
LTFAGLEAADWRSGGTCRRSLKCRSTRGKLSVASLSLEIGFQTLDTGDEGLHLLFTTQGDEQTALAQALSRLGAAA